MTTLITGATGFIGGWIARLLHDAGEPLRALVRPHSNRDDLSAMNIDLIEGDLQDAASLDRALEGVTRMYHAAGWISFKPRDAHRVRDINFTGTVNLMNAALAHGVERVVYTASIFGLGAAEGPDQLATEATGFNRPRLESIPYLKAKLDAEAAVQGVIDQGLSVVRLYPGLCLGPGDTNRSSSGAIDSWLNGKLPAILTGGGICLMDVRDAATAHIAAMTHGTPGEKYLATGYNVTLPDLFERLSVITGRPAPRLRLPASMALPFTGIAEWLGMLPGFEHAELRLMAHHWWYDSCKAIEELGVRFRPLDDTLRETVEWLQANTS